MWIADHWTEYQVLDTSLGEKLENWGGYLLIRPDPQVIWESRRNLRGWSSPNARYHRSSRGGGEWEFIDLPETWDIHYTLGQDAEVSSSDTATRTMTFHLKPFAFKHTGVFPEQAVNWDWCSERIRKRF